MNTDLDEQLLHKALEAATDTRRLTIEAGARHRAAEEYEVAFGRHPAAIVADANTYAAAGQAVEASFQRAGAVLRPPILFGRDCYAGYDNVERLRDSLAAHDAIPVTVGSGTLNDLTKRAAHELGRPYMIVATAASMDGYTSYGASITRDGQKITMECPAPRAVLADLEVIDAAPAGMNASGYADLVAKVPAGADWIIADALGVEPIHPQAWETVQGRLRAWIARPEAHSLILGLMMSGFAMQAARASRPAAGAEHQFSHLWEMQHHTHNGIAPSHGFKVGIGTLASMALHEEMLLRDARTLDIDRCVQAWPSLERVDAEINELLGGSDLAAKAHAEMRAKHLSPEELRRQLMRLCDCWPDLARRLREQLPALEEVRQLMRAAGCPVEPEQIGITRQRLRRSYRQAYLIRSRFTVLDLAARTGWFEPALEKLFA